ncbi:MAG: VCBS repeat-containing protein [Labilithrix sp.]|nr:VCBS repeat-containing protein [Labilithrix sp.]
MCWHEFIGVPTGEQEALKLLVIEAIRQSWHRFTRLNVSWVDCPTSGTAKHVRTKFVWNTTGFLGGLADLGMVALTSPADRGPGLDPPGFRINVPSTWNDTGTRDAFRALLMHEFGHILGFDHEYQHPQGNPSDLCYQQRDYDGGIAVGGPDPESVMGLWYCPGALQRLSLGDIQGAQQIYGTPPLRQVALWRQNSGQVAAWQMNEDKIFGEVYPGAPDSTWKIEAVGDFNGNGSWDIFWRRTTTGVTSIWFMNNGALVNTIAPGSVGSDWQIEGVGDFDGDGRSDLFWRHTSGVTAIWYDGQKVRSQHYPGTVGFDWKFEGVGDFDGDGRSDVFWRHNTGVTAIWYSGDKVRPQHYPGSVSASWIFEGVGNFDGDSRSDVLWRQTGSGVTSIWYSGDQIRAPGYPGAIPFQWTVLGIGDFNADNKTDIMWRLDSSGQTAIWFMDGSGRSRSTGYPRVVNSSWEMHGLLRRP